MCNSFFVDKNIARELFDLNIESSSESIVGIGDIFPSDYCNVIIKNGDFKLFKMKWFYSSNLDKTNIFNARIETVFEKPIFKNSILNRRCIIPVSYFYEYENLKSEKIKHKIFSKNKNVLFLAAIYNIFKKEDEFFYGFSILTKESDFEVKKIHNRMPIIIEKNDLKLWLDKVTKKATLLNLCENKIYEDLKTSKTLDEKFKQIEIQGLI